MEGEKLFPPPPPPKKNKNKKGNSKFVIMECINSLTLA